MPELLKLLLQYILKTRGLLKTKGSWWLKMDQPFATGSIKDTYNKYNHLKDILSAMVYGEMQVKELEETINKSDCYTVVIGTPIDLARIIDINKDSSRVRYELQEIGKPDLADIIKNLLQVSKFKLE